MQHSVRFAGSFGALLVLLVSSRLGAAADSPRTPARPNVVFLLADDMRWDALGCMGNRLARTPNLDALASQGMLFRNHFVTTSICCVSRASIFSGQYERRHGIGDFATPFSAAAFSRTYPMLMRAAGYRTGFIGKFGVGEKMPEKEFDYWRGFPGQGDYFEKGSSMHLTEKIGNQSIEFLTSAAGRPFCLSVSFKAPHSRDGAAREFPPDARDEALYADTIFPVPATAREEFFQALPEFVRNSEGRVRWKRRFTTPEMFQKTVRDYQRLIFGVDREIGRIVETLRKQGQLDHTLIIFTSDNGFFYGERGMADKWLMYEPSIRVPLIVREPAAPARNRGRTQDAMTLNIDLAPTMLDFAGIAAPASMQGRSLLPLSRNEKVSWRREWFYEHHTLPKIIPPSEGVRTEQWKYLRWVGVEPAIEELYDLASDPEEKNNLVASERARQTLIDLRNRWNHLRQELK